MKEKWTEKYRPSSLDNVINQTVSMERLKSLLKSVGNMPHLLFAGPPGTGKTTTAICIAKHIMNNNWRDFTLELNASDERGIQIVREKVKNFARTKSLGNVPFKIIFSGFFNFQINLCKFIQIDNSKKE